MAEPTEFDYKEEYFKIKSKYDNLVKKIDNQTITQSANHDSFQQNLLSKSDKLYKTLLKNYPHGTVVIFDKDMRYLLSDGQGLAQIGLSNEMLENKLMYEILTEETCKILEPVYKKAFEGISTTLDVPFSGNIYLVNVIPILEEDNIINYGMAITQNISEKVKYHHVLENELTSRTKELKRLTYELEKSIEQLNRFAYVASHDLQEPLRTVASFSQLLVRRYKDKIDDAGKDYVNTIVMAVLRMQRLIEDLLNYSKTGSNLNRESTSDLNNVINIVSDNIDFLIEKSHAKINCGNLPIVRCDKTLMIQLFQNLIVNAIKYRRNETPVIDIDCIQKDKYWQFSVKDNGIGIEEKFFEKIFVVFQRLHNKDSYSGTGIGLANCKKIIELYDGKIWVESTLGEGSTFYFTFPV